jgi:hypothetical protein
MAEFNGVYLVVGTGRSETSTVARILRDKLDVHMGSNFETPTGHNPHGNFEDRDFVDANKGLIGGLLTLQEWSDIVVGHINQRNHMGVPWGINDPGMSYMLGLYLQLLPNHRIIRCKRDRGLVLEGLKKCHGHTQESAEKLFDSRERLLDNFLSCVDHLELRFGKDEIPDEMIETSIQRKWEPKKLYVAVLNRGSIRRELTIILDKIRTTPGIEVCLEPLTMTFGEPICSNRASIVRRFLDTDCDFLMMIDDDIIPLHNPAELVFADKDIVGFPAKVRQRGRALNWVAYMKVLEGIEGYTPVDFSLHNSSDDLIPVDIVGTGCILIKRRVLEQLKQPFLVEFDEHGISSYGTDFAFCRKAKDALFEIFSANPTTRPCEHAKTLGLLDIGGYDDSDYRNVAPAKYGMPWGAWAITQKDWEFIEDIIKRENVGSVLEFGSGLSSLLMSEKQHVVSYETDDKWAEEIRGKMNGNSLDIRTWDGKGVGLLPMFDLAFVDGPKGEGSGGPGREHSMRLAARYADKVIVHDAGREKEIRWQNKYLRPHFKVVSKSGHHQQRCQYWVRNKLAA